MDFASLALFCAAAILLIALFVHFLMYIRVRYEHKAEITTSKGVISGIQDKADRAEKAAIAARDRAEEIHAATEARFATAEAATEKVRLRHEALDESVSSLNAKTAARERALEKAAKRAGRAAVDDGESGTAPAGDGGVTQSDLLAAIAEVERGQSRAGSNGGARLRPKR